MLITIQNDGAGGFHLHLHMQSNGTAESLVSNDRFVIQDVFPIMLNIGPGTVSHREESFHVIGLGGAPNFSFHGAAHITITPDGDVAVDFERTGESCG